jgi:hypothetical protein
MPHWTPARPTSSEPVGRVSGRHRAGARSQENRPHVHSGARGAGRVPFGNRHGSRAGPCRVAAYSKPLPKITSARAPGTGTSTS